MLRGLAESPGDISPQELQAAYERRLAETVERVGLERAVEETGLDPETLGEIEERAGSTLTLAESASILALEEGLPDADAIEAEARDILLMGMSTAVLDVEALSAGIEDRLEPKELQQKVEGRYPMTLEEYALVHQYIESRKR